MGHIHAENMALFAEDAKTHAEPWKLWQIKNHEDMWVNLDFIPSWDPSLEYRRKPKTHIVNGVEIPDLRIRPKDRQEYWYPDASTEYLVSRVVCRIELSCHIHRKANNLCYEPTEEGKQAAILHSKAWLGTAGNKLNERVENEG